MPELTPEAKELLEDHYGHHVRTTMSHEAVALTMTAVPVAFAPLDPALLHALAESAASFGIDPASVDWTTVIPQIIAAITTGSWFSLIPIFIKYGPAFYALVKQIIALFHVQPTPTPGGPTITG